MTNYDVVRKLIGEVNPIGETNEDNKRYENLKELTLLTGDLLAVINDVAIRHKDSHEFSVKRSGEHAIKFINKLGV